MNLKQTIIKVNDVLCYIALLFVALWAGILALAGETVGALVVGGGGFIVCCLVFGVWMCLSQIAENSQKQTELLKKILDKNA